MYKVYHPVLSFYYPTVMGTWNPLNMNPHPVYYILADASFSCLHKCFDGLQLIAWRNAYVDFTGIE